MNEYIGNLRRQTMALEPCTPTNLNHHQQDSGCISADRGTLDHLGTWTPDEILNAVNVVKL